MISISESGPGKGSGSLRRNFCGMESNNSSTAVAPIESSISLRSESLLGRYLIPVPYQWLLSMFLRLSRDVGFVSGGIQEARGFLRVAQPGLYEPSRAV